MISVPPNFRSTTPAVRVVTGLDLGQQQDYTALTRIEWTPDRPRFDMPKPNQYAMPTLYRWPLQSKYLEIVGRLARYFNQPDTIGSMLVIDHTGVGRPVYEQILSDLTRANCSFTMLGVTITGGHAVSNHAPGHWRVAKGVLVGVMRAVMGTGRLKAAPSEHSHTLIRELETFKVKVSAVGNETFESWREKDHDDLVLATALALWAAETIDQGPDGETQFERTR